MSLSEFQKKLADLISEGLGEDIHPDDIIRSLQIEIDEVREIEETE